MSIANSNVAPATEAAPVSTDRAAMAMVTTLFFMWGFLTCLNDILIPHLKAIFDLTYAKAMLIQFSFFGAYFVFALPSGKLIEWIGYKKAMVGGLLTMGVGALLFVPAASAPSFPLFLAALIILAAGITLLQVSANPYVAVLGPERTASSRLNLTQAFNSLGTTVAPWFGSMLILSGAPAALDVIRKMSPDQLHDYRLEQASSVKLPVSRAWRSRCSVLGLIIAKFQAADHYRRRTPRKSSRLRLEISATGNGRDWNFRLRGRGSGDWKHAGELHEPAERRKHFDSARREIRFPLLGRCDDRPIHRIGRAAESAHRNGAGFIRADGVSAWLRSRCCSFGHLAMWSILLVGFFNSTMFPSIFTLSIEGLGPLTGKGSAVLVCAIVGGAIIPELQGVLADHIGIHHAFILPALCYLYIAFFAFRSNQPHGRAPALS